jgi:tetratricopeptide (TPR) repeat protein
MPVDLVIAGTQDLRSSLGATLSAGVGWTLAAVGLLLVLGCALWPPLRALWLANLGAVRQAQIELSAYDYVHHADLSLDKIRQRENLAGATYRYQHTLALREHQVTARTRLAAIALSRGQYEQALAHVQTAWDAGHHDQVTRILLSDALIATGDPERALELVRGTDWAEMRLVVQAWDRYWWAGDYQRASDAWHVIVGLDPSNESARRWLTEAQAKVGQP